MLTPESNVKWSSSGVIFTTDKLESEGIVISHFLKSTKLKINVCQRPEVLVRKYCEEQLSKTLAKHVHYIK